MKVFLNPGHSLNANPDAGCVYNGTKEAIICAEIAAKVSKILALTEISTIVYQQQGANLTSNQQLNKVASVANSSNADIFVSIHMNGFIEESANGTEAWYLSGSTEGKKLSEAINSELSDFGSIYKIKNRGCKIDQRGLYVLKATKMPATLIEVGFISNVEENKFIVNNTDLIAKKIANGIYKYFFNKDIELSKTEFKIVLKDIDCCDLYINNILKFKNNKFSTISSWIECNYNS